MRLQLVTGSTNSGATVRLSGQMTNVVKLTMTRQMIKELTLPKIRSAPVDGGRVSAARMVA